MNIEARGGFVVLALAISGIAIADDTPTDDGDTPTIETITVTGQKISRDIQDTPDSVAVITTADLEERNLIDLQDVIERTANVTTRDGSSFSIRGINSLNVSGAGQGDLATIYVDGSPMPRQASFAGPVDIWDVTQVEIFRGPQSTLQGRASLAGAIIINTANPTYDWQGRVRTTYTNDEDERRVGVAFGGPLVDDQLAFRVAYEQAESDGFGRNVTTGGLLNATDSDIARVKLLIEPAALPDLEILLSHSREQRTSGETFNSLSVEDPGGQRVGFNDFPILYDTVTDITVLTASYDFSDRWSLTSITGYNEVDYDYLFDEDRTAEPQSILTLDSFYETTTQELQLFFAGDSMDAVFGVYLSRADTPRSINNGSRGLDLDNDLGLGLILQSTFGLDPATAAFVVAQYPNPALINITSDFSQEVDTSAVFADLSWDFADNWTLYAGFRYDREQQKNQAESTVTQGSTLPDPALYPAPLNQVIAGVNAFLIAEGEDASSPSTFFASPEFGGFLPKLGIGYRFDSSRSASFSIQRGYRSGGAAINAARAQAYDFDQEFTWNYEFSLRNQLLDNRLILNANIFFIDWTDQQVRVQLSESVFDTEIQNAGASSVYGFELESQYSVSNELDVYGSIGYARTEFDEFNVIISGEAIDFAGNEFAFAPQWTVNVGSTWRPTRNTLANINANYASASFIRGDRPQSSRDSDARTLVNFRIGWDNERVGVFVTGQNLLDEEYVITQFPNDPTIPEQSPEFAQYGNPRTFGVQVEARF
ncbi:MAG: TonB-dependent receptor [Pseudomonadota bacterium]